MKKTRKILFLIVTFAIAAAISLIAVACAPSKKPEEKPDYTLTFMNGTAEYDKVVGKEGSDVTLNKQDPTRYNHVFVGWSLSENGAVTELPSKMPARDITYYAVFSPVFYVTLDAGIGEVPSGSERFTLGVGEKLYDKVKDITPTVSGDSTFVAWYYGSEELNANSSAVMPSTDVRLTARYSVGYSITVFKQSDYGMTDEDDYILSSADSVSNGVGIVGETPSNFPSFTGYTYNTEMSGLMSTIVLSSERAKNNFFAYYDVIGCTLIFNANLPADVSVSGSVDPQTKSYGAAVTLGKCAYRASGYRFVGWADKADGEIVYREGDEVELVDNVTLYGVWSKAFTDVRDRSYDRIYVYEKRVDSELKTIAVLERYGYEDIDGTFDESTGEFSFADGDSVWLRGVVDFSSGLYSYIDLVGATEYKLSTRGGFAENSLNLVRTVVDGTTLSLGENGTATYTVNGTPTQGKYAVDESGSMKFIPSGDGDTFYFRIVTYGDMPVFEIRDDMYGEWFNLDHTFVVDDNYSVSLDGYGSVVMTAKGYDTSLEASTFSFSGLYALSTADFGNDGTEVLLRIVNNDLLIREYAVLLVSGTEFSTAGDEPVAYDKVYLEKLTLGELTGRGTDEGDGLTLSGYNILPNSAEYTHKDASGNTVTEKGRYELDDDYGMLRVIVGTKSYSFELTTDTETSNVYFEQIDDLAGQYYILGLENTFAPRGLYMFRIHNNGLASFAMRTPGRDPFLGVVTYQYMLTVTGKYSAVAGELNKFTFVADISDETVTAVYRLYYSWLQRGLDISNFGHFDFGFDSQTYGFTVANVTAVGDGYCGETITYSGAEYVLDGRGNAYNKAQYTVDEYGWATPQEGASDALKYTPRTALGLDCVLLEVPQAEGDPTTVMYIDPGVGDLGLLELNTEYISYNTPTMFRIMALKDNAEDGTQPAVLSIALQSGYSYVLNAFSVGRVKFDADGRGGVYEATEDLDGSFVGLCKEYRAFRFELVTVGTGDSATDRMYLVPIENDEDTFTLECDGQKLVLTDTADAHTAVYTYKNGDTVTGNYSLRGEFLAVTQVTGEGDDAVTTVVTLSVTKDASGAITSFERVGNEAGYYLDNYTSADYLYLSGKATDETGAYFGAVYYEFDSETREYTAHAAKYAANTDVNSNDEPIGGFKLSFDEESMKERDFTFMQSTAQSTPPVFGKYRIPCGINVFRINMSTGGTQNVGTLTGGGFNLQVFTVANTYQYYGELKQVEERNLYSFTLRDNPSIVYYFSLMNINNSTVAMLLDNMVASPDYGKLYRRGYADSEYMITLPATDDDLEREVNFTYLEATGMSVGYLHYEGEDTTVERPGVYGIYMQYSSGMYLFGVLSGDGTEVIVLLRFSVVTEDGHIYVVPVDRTVYGTFHGADHSAVSLNGIDTAVYVDTEGCLHTAVFGKLAGVANVISIMYIDWSNFELVSFYIEIDSENGTYVRLADNDPRLPSAQE